LRLLSRILKASRDGRNGSAHSLTGRAGTNAAKAAVQRPKLLVASPASPSAETVLPPEEGASILDEIAAALGRHVILPPGGAETTALWVLHAHAHDAAQISPLLAIISPDIGCGKTTLLAALAELTPASLFVSDLTSAGLYRTITRAKHTLLIDEGEMVLSGNTLLRRLVNSGHRRDGARVLRADNAFDTWCPKVLASVGDPPVTVCDRSIRIFLNRKRHSTVAPLDAVARARLNELSLQAAQWTTQRLDRIAAANPAMPAMPATLGNHTADNWRPLTAIADEAGGRWPDLARSLATQATPDAEADESSAIGTLRDIRQAFAREETDRMATISLVHAQRRSG